MNNIHSNSLLSLLTSKFSAKFRLLLMFLFVGFTGFAQIAESTPGPYTFTVPAGVTSLNVQIWGAGGAGGGSDGLYGGSGGGSGDYVAASSIPVVAGQSISYTVGVGGLGYNGDGLAGGKSSFSSIIANGGAAGKQNQGPLGRGGNGGDASGSGGIGGTGGTNSNGSNGFSPGGGGGGGDGFFLMLEKEEMAEMVKL